MTTPETLLTPDQMQQMIIECRSSVKFDLNQMELLAMKPGLSETSRRVCDFEAGRLRLLLDRINALVGCR